MTHRHRELWKCPRCGHRFVTRNLWHSCVRVRVADHFRAKAPALRSVFQTLRTVVRSCGPATCYAQKTRIVFQARVRFAGVVARRQWLEFGLWLRRAVTHPALVRVESFGRLGFGHYFRLRAPADIDDALKALIAEAYTAAHAGPATRRTGT
ncbi:MAG TPA: DUF5655 domain-containing protein [Gemmatimonadales bacterium]|nr:DUF5655 domain-containing protein [Gemmatimonadales bacterium]